MTSKPITTSEIRARKARGEKLVMCTAYDATFASILDTAGVDILLVGDSLGMVIQGHETTIPVTLDHMIYHTRAVTRGTKRAHVVGDMRLMQEGRAHSVKLEGGQELAPTIARITEAGIPVMGHVGLTPQSVHAMGGFKIQGRNSEGAQRILDDALALQAAGCFPIVLEGIPLDLAKEITSQLEIPTIGIGAGVHCDGQVLVCYDMLGMNEGFKPKFLKEYANLHEVIVGAVENYADEVRAGEFPSESHSFKSKKLRLVEGEESKLYGTTA